MFSMRLIGGISVSRERVARPGLTPSLPAVNFMRK